MLDCEPETIRTGEAARILNVSKARVRQLVREGKIPVVDGFGKQLRFNPRSLRAAVKSAVTYAGYERDERAEVKDFVRASMRKAFGGMQR